MTTTPSDAMPTPYTTEHAVLDHGWVRLRNIAGPNRRQLEEDRMVLRAFDADDTDIAQSARMSFEQMDSERTLAADMKLTDYLLAHQHTGPFEQIVVWLEMKLPIFVARQFVRHRTARICEVSARYKELPGDWYIPDRQRVLVQSADKKQGGRGANLDDPAQALVVERYLHTLKLDCETSYDFYLEAIRNGIAMEQARLHLHVNHYTHWLFQMDLHNLMHFLNLRVDPHAQWEAQEYGRAIVSLLDPVIPGLMAAWRREKGL